MVSLRSISTVLTSALLVQASKNALVAPVHEAPKQDFAESKPHLEPRYEIAPGAAGLSQGALNTLGLVAGVVGLISSGIGLANFFMEKYKRRGPEFQIKLGLSPPNGTAHGTEFGGKIKDVQAYDAFNRKLGDTGCKGTLVLSKSLTVVPTVANSSSLAAAKKIRDGGLWISHLPDKDYGVQVDFMSVEADEKDALCISWITLTNYGNLDAAGGLWNGDIGRACGETWYPGNQIAGAHKDGSKWRPACTWIGGTKNKKGKDTWAPIKSMAIKWAVHEYIEDRAVKTLEDNRVCRSTLFTDKPDILETSKSCQGFLLLRHDGGLTRNFEQWSPRRRKGEGFREGRRKCCPRIMAPRT